MAIQPKLSRLKSQLASSKVKEEDFPLFQVVSQLIDTIKQLQEATIGTITTVVTGGLTAVLNAIALIKNSDLVSHTDESVEFPNSRMLVAGANIVFDISTPNQLSIISASPDRVWSILTNGNSDNPEIIFAGSEVVMISVP